MNKLGLVESRCSVVKVVPESVESEVKKERLVHFTVVCLVTWPMNESEAGVDLVLIETSLLFLCKVLLISMTTISLT